MDKWKDSELQRMKVGGNANFKDFLSTRSDVTDKSSFDDIYSSKSAALYRDKIATLAEGKPWSEETSPAQNYVPHKTSSSGGLKVVNKNGSATAAKSSPLDLDKDSLEDFLNSETHARNKDDFFSRLQQENESKRDDIPPSQGGKYVGFGNTVHREPAPSVTNSLYSGWSSFSSNAYKWGSAAKDGAYKLGAVAKDKAGQLGSTVNENIIKPTHSKYNDGTLLTDLGSGAASIATKMQSAGNRMWTGQGNTADSRGDSIYNGSDGYNDFGGYQDNQDHSYTAGPADYGSGTRSNKTKHSARSSQKQQDDGWNDTSWEDSNWGDFESTTTSPSSSASKNKSRPSQSKKVSKPTKGLEEDLKDPWDESAWETVEQEYKMKMNLK